MHATDTRDPAAELCLELIELHGLRNSNSFGDARRQFKAAMLIQRYKDCRAYPVLLRSADFCLMLDEDVESCCFLLEQAARISLECGEMQEAASAYVALSQQYGYHDLTKAEDCLARAEVIAQSSWVEMPAILNNKAVLALYRGEIGSEGLQLLEDALILVSDTVDEVLVRLNLLVHRMLAGERSGKGIAELEALLDGSLQDAEILRIAHFNLERACLDLARETQAGRHGSAWRAVRSSLDEAFWTFRRSGNGQASLATWRLGLDYFPVLLSHWKLGAIPFDAVHDQP